MKVNNAQLISLLFDEPELVKALNQAIPYISVFKEKTINGERSRTVLNLRCLDISSLTSLLKFRSHLASKLIPLLGYEIHLEYIQNAIGETGMVAVAERQITENNTEQIFYPLEPLAEATRKSIPEVKILLAEMGAVIHPRIDGSEEIEEFVFDAVLSRWAKTLKGSTSVVTAEPIANARPRKTATKVLAAELTVEDIIKIKNGEKANSPNLTKKGVQQTLENFFSKVNMDDTGEVDAVSAFIEGTSEFGQALRKKIMAAYKKFTKGGNLQEIQDKLIVGAKVYLESMATAASQE